MLTLDPTSLKIATARFIICMYYKKEQKLTIDELISEVGAAYEKVYGTRDARSSLKDLYNSGFTIWETKAGKLDVFQITGQGITFAKGILDRAETNPAWEKYVRQSNSPNVGSRATKGAEQLHAGTW